MKLRRLFVFGCFLGLTAAAAVLAPEVRYPWIVTAALAFAGILLFDTYSEVPRTWPNGVLFTMIYGLTLLAVLETSAENFWRDEAGAVFLLTILLEQNSMPWSGLGLLRSTVTPAIFFYLLTLTQGIPFLTPETSFFCGLGGVLVYSFLEIFSILRENNDLNSGSFMSAVRAAACGVGILFYSATFLPGSAKEMPFVYIRLGLPALALLVALVGVLFKQWRRRYILFCCNWSLFVFWAAICGEPRRFYAAVAALIAGVWTIMMTNKKAIDPGETRDLYLKLSAWGIPGSFMFSMILFALFPSEDALVKQGTVVWLVTFFIYWSNLRKFEFPKKSAGTLEWKWQNSVALAVTIAGAGLVAGAKYFADVMTMAWGLSK